MLWPQNYNYDCKNYNQIFHYDQRDCLQQTLTTNVSIVMLINLYIYSGAYD